MWAVQKLARQSVMSPSSSSSPASFSRRLFAPSLLFSFFLSSALLTQMISPSSATACGKDDWMFSYTECDSSGSRWRVAVPKNPEKEPCEIKKTPVKGQSCSFSCPAGKYMAVQGDQECHDCDPGTYSLGGGLRFDDWTTIPSQLAVHSERIDMKDIFPDMKVDSGDNCTNSWIPKGSFIAGIPGNCASSITLSVSLVKAGTLTYEYQYPDTNVLLQFVAQNDLCQDDEEADRDESNKWPETTGNEWRTVTIDLKKGLNTLRWKMISFNLDPDQRLQPILIKRIEVTGVAFTSSCAPCPAGTYSGKGADHCTPCPRNRYSQRHSASCQICNDKTEYSDPGSSKCEARPACKANDYFAYRTPCNERKQTTKMYKWIQPKVCRDDLKDAKRLPPSGKAGKCPPCNPGMEYAVAKIATNGTTAATANPTKTNSCQFCPPNYYSDGFKKCAKCPANTAPSYGYTYQWWEEKLPGMTATCLSMDESGCSTSEGWQPSGDHIHSGHGHQDNVYLVLTLDVDGFQTGSIHSSSSSSATEVGRISFVFELDCGGQCEFYFMMDIKDKQTSVINSWKGKTAKQMYSFVINDPAAVTFSWAFQKTSWEDLDPGLTRFVDDIAKIYSIKVTNTKKGGAAECIPCPRAAKGDGNGCIPCPKGHYINDKTSTCEKCPEGSIAKGGFGVGVESCVKCGPGLVSHNGEHCFSACAWTDPETKKTYDFSALSGTHIVDGSKLFTASGTQYYHQFNFSLCGSPESTVACVNNVKVGGDKSSSDGVNARVCRTTIIPSTTRKAGYPGLAAQAVSLGDEVIAVTDAHFFDNLNMTKEFERKATKSSLRKAAVVPGAAKVGQAAAAPKDIHFYFRSNTPTTACPKGRSTIITMRCDIDDKSLKGELSLPPKCADGTCDGCNFNILWSTGAACPICSDLDFRQIKGECKDSKQTIHFIPPETCRLMSEVEKTKVKPCTVVLPMIVQIGIVAGLGVGALLALLVYYFWYKNRRLEYKYMKLVAGSGGAPKLNKDGEIELPTADSCAVDSDDEDDEENDEFDSVDFKEGSRKKNLLDKLKNMGGGGGGGGGGGMGMSGKNNYGSDIETNLLNEKVFHEL